MNLVDLEAKNRLKEKRRLKPIELLALQNAQELTRQAIGNVAGSEFAYFFAESYKNEILRLSGILES